MATTKRTCSIPDCIAKTIARGLCNKHYIRMTRTGTTDDPSTPSKADRFHAKVDKSGDCWEWTGSRDINGYGKMIVDGKLVGAHRIAYELANGPIPAGMTIDHRCFNGGCVRPSHLRLATQKQNGEYKRLQANNVSGLRGVRWRERNSKWEANITHYGRQIHLGSFSTREDAEHAARSARAELFTFPEAI